MPRTSFDSANKAKVGGQYPKFKLERGERARIVVIDREPMVEYVHTLRAPQVANGRVVMEQVQDQSGNLVERPKEDFIGQHICLGDFETLEANGSDPGACPTCAAGKEEPAIGTPWPRYATHVVRYATQPGSFNVQDPFSVTLIGWSFGPSRFNDLIDLQQEWGRLEQRDLLLGPCESKQFQKYAINVASGCEWLMDESRKNTVAKLYKDNRGDLTSLIGRKLARHLIEEDVTKVLNRVRIASGSSGMASTPMPASANAAAASVDIESMLGGDPAPQPTETQAQPAPSTTEASEGGSGLDDILGGDTPAAETPAAATDADRPSEGELDFDDLLNGLG